ncbi:uncharacterized protein LOC134540700 [Bacillus rossius redtenbacheri]|uniref:uncharacterized protein LOC134540700 n=1 Tax=Bacillus rossius redtenbacheri TaxID=93214 RepID=UPI002FDE275B
MCKVCNCKIKADITNIKCHRKSSRHIKLSSASTEKSKQSLHFYLQKESNATIDVQVKEAEIKLAAAFAAHNLPFSVMDHLQEVLKGCFPYSKIAQSIQIKRTKTTAVIKNIIGDSHKNILADQLRDSKFSILTDESTDISCVKTSCIIVRFFDDIEGRVLSRFWELIQVFEPSDAESVEKGATAQHLYAKIVESFQKANIPLINVIGFGSDGCNTMMGKKKNSVASRFREACPGIVIVKCICHSLHLCASTACKALPRRCEDLARNIHGFLKNSSKRQCQLATFQTFNMDVHKMLHPSQTRWLSLLIVVERLLENWEPLRLFFIDRWLGEDLVSAEQIK